MGTTELEGRMVKKTSFTRATRKIMRLGRRRVISRGTRSSRRRRESGQEARDGVRRKPAGSATGRACSTEASVLPPPKTPTSWQGARVGKQRHGQGPGNAGRGRDRGQQPGTPRERSADPATWASLETPRQPRSGCERPRAPPTRNVQNRRMHRQQSGQVAAEAGAGGRTAMPAAGVFQGDDAAWSLTVAMDVHSEYAENHRPTRLKERVSGYVSYSSIKLL